MAQYLELNTRKLTINVDLINPEKNGIVKLFDWNYPAFNEKFNSEISCVEGEYEWIKDLLPLRITKFHFTPTEMSQLQHSITLQRNCNGTMTSKIINLSRYSNPLLYNPFKVNVKQQMVIDSYTSITIPIVPFCKIQIQFELHSINFGSFPLFNAAGRIYPGPPDESITSDKLFQESSKLLNKIDDDIKAAIKKDTITERTKRFFSFKKKEIKKIITEKKKEKF